MRHDGVRYAERNQPPQRSRGCRPAARRLYHHPILLGRRTLKSPHWGSTLAPTGVSPKLTDGEVLTMEVVGEFLGLDTDQPIGQYFRQHWRSWFLHLGSRTTFTQQAANLWAIKQALHRRLVIDLGAATDPIRIVDGCPLPLTSDFPLWDGCGKP